jgi:MarR family transcriptional regulator, organic hydroperoxide resistance regulator
VTFGALREKERENDEEAIIKVNGGFLITKIKQIQGRVFARIMANSGIDEFNGAQGRILHVLWDHDDIPISELARRTGLAKTTLTSMLDRLEAAAYLRRAFDEHDRRRINIRLTDRAHAMKAQYDAVSHQMSEIFYDGFSETEIAEFETYLERVLTNLSRREEE